MQLHARLWRATNRHSPSAKTTSLYSRNAHQRAHGTPLGCGPVGVRSSASGHFQSRRQIPALASSRPSTMFLARRLAVRGDRKARTEADTRASRYNWEVRLMPASVCALRAAHTEAKSRPAWLLITSEVSLVLKSRSL